MAAMPATLVTDDLAPLHRHAVAAFVAHLRDERGLSPHTVAAYQRDATQFLAFAARAGVADPAAVEPLLLRRFLALLRTRGLAAASIARKAAALRACFRYLDLAGDTVRVLGKGAREREVPFGEPAREALLDYLTGARPAMLPAGA